MKTFVVRFVPVLVLGAAALSAQAVTYDLANDFSITNGNPNGVWSYGYFATPTSTTFLAATSGQTQPFGPGWFGPGGVPDVEKNTTGAAGFGIDPGKISLDADNGTPVVRFTAAFTGSYFVSLTFGGTTDTQVNPIGTGNGNADAHNGGLLLNGTALALTPAGNNFYTYTGTLTLLQGQTLDAYVGQGYGSGNTQTAFTIATPGPLAALPFALMAIKRRRRKA